ncbi:unnamed protein product, partial [Amoebophrya sp. A120]|eukprot:GSA120T00016102001.1
MTRVARLQYAAFTVAAVFTVFLPSRCRAAGSTSPNEFMQNNVAASLLGDERSTGPLAATSVGWNNAVKEQLRPAFFRGRARFRELLRHVQEGDKSYIVELQGLTRKKKPAQPSGVLFSQSLLSDWYAFRSALKFLHKNVGPSTGLRLQDAEDIEDAPSASLIATLWQEVTGADPWTKTAYPKSLTAALLALENGLGGGRLVGGVPKASEEPGTRSTASDFSHDEDTQLRRRNPRSRSSSSRSSTPRTGGTQGRASGLRRERVRSRDGGARVAGEDESPAGSTSTAASALERRPPTATVCEQYV